MDSIIAVDCGPDAVQAAWHRVHDEYDFYAAAFLAAPEKLRYDVTSPFSESPSTYLEYCLSQRADEVQRGLQSLCLDASQPAQRRIVAARFLTKRGDATGISAYIEVIQSGSAEDQIDALGQLFYFQLDEEHVRRIADAITLLISDENTDVASAATDAMETLKNSYDYTSKAADERTAALHDETLRKEISGRLAPAERTMARLKEVIDPLTPDGIDTYEMGRVA